MADEGKKTVRFDQTSPEFQAHVIRFRGGDPAAARKWFNENRYRDQTPAEMVTVEENGEFKSCQRIERYLMDMMNSYSESARKIPA